VAPRILIADDHPDTLKALQVVLEHNSRYEVCFAAVNGSEAVIKAQELRPDLIILDLTMPLMNGLEAAREISKVLPSTAILLHTLTEIPQLQAANVGIREVISKAAPHLLLHAVENALIKEGTAPSPPQDPILPAPMLSPNETNISAPTQPADPPNPDPPLPS
jgi:DNA-binding NarL/FixJ family response regulator